MLYKIASLFLVLAITGAFCRPSTLAQSLSTSDSEPDNPETSATAPAKVTAENERNENLRANVALLLSNARAGKITPPPKPQITPANANHLSKKTKIVIVVVAVTAALAITAIVIRNGFKWNCKSRCVI